MQHFWYQPKLSLFTFLLLPISFLFRSVVALRQFLYQTKILKTYSVPVPVIVVGNITVGGTGKTPFVIWLADFLKQKGFKPGIVSRGVGGKMQSLPRWVTKESNVNAVGDEALLIAERTECPIVIGIDRVAAVNELLAKTDCNVVISDDGLQHYRLGREMEIAIVDATRGFGNHQFLPAGPLRESVKRLNSVNLVIKNGEGELNNFSSKKIVSMVMHGDNLISLRDPAMKLPLEHFANQEVYALAAIGNPERFFNSLRSKGLKLRTKIFPDHHLYSAPNFSDLKNLPIIMTEKDAVKCRTFGLENAWYLPVTAKITSEIGALIVEELRVS